MDGHTYEVFLPVFLFFIKNTGSCFVSKTLYCVFPQRFCNFAWLMTPVFLNNTVLPTLIVSKVLFFTSRLQALGLRVTWVSELHAPPSQCTPGRRTSHNIPPFRACNTVLELGAPCYHGLLFIVAFVPSTTRCYKKNWGQRIQQALYDHWLHDPQLPHSGLTVH